MLKPGLQASIQDLGRPGYRHLGVGLSGAMDRLSLAIGNAIVGNRPDAAGLELTLPPVRLRFESACTIALTGADCPALLDQVPLGLGRRIAVAAGQTLQLAKARVGMRAYLCISGGIDVPPILGSRSTDLQAHLGGLAGRALRAGDRLRLGSAPLTPRAVLRPNDSADGKAERRPDDNPSTASPVAVRLPQMTGAIRIMAGPEFADFDATAHDALVQTHWTVAPQSNRMGYRLLGATLGRGTAQELNSHAVYPGLIQVPPGGAPIVLMADAQATGGYPRIACVIAADQWRLAQASPGATIGFERVTRAQALLAWQKQRKYLALLREGLDANRSECRSG